MNKLLLTSVILFSISTSLFIYNFIEKSKNSQNEILDYKPVTATLLSTYPIVKNEKLYGKSSRIYRISYKDNEKLVYADMKLSNYASYSQGLSVLVYYHGGSGEFLSPEEYAEKIVKYTLNEAMSKVFLYLSLLFFVFIIWRSVYSDVDIYKTTFIFLILGSLCLIISSVLTEFDKLINKIRKIPSVKGTVIEDISDPIVEYELYGNKVRSWTNTYSGKIKKGDVIDIYPSFENNTVSILKVTEVNLPINQFKIFGIIFLLISLASYGYYGYYVKKS